MTDPLEALNDAEHWPQAAASLAARGDRSALPALVAAYDLPVERSRVPLLDAMEAVGGVQAVGELASSNSSAERLLAARLAAMLPDPAHLPALERLVPDPHRTVSARAREALRLQIRDADWKAIVRRLAEADDPELRAAATAMLTP